MKLTFVTGNANKLREMREIIDRFPFIELDHQEIDLAEIQGATALEIVQAKCREARKHIPTGAIIVEDTSLSFDAFGGELPGPYIKWFLDAMGPAKLLHLVDGFDDRRATARCCMAVSMSPDDDDGSIEVFVGETRGEIVTAGRFRPETARFGWDPIFLPEGFDQTYAEMDAHVKHSISHRARALSKLAERLALCAESC